MKGVQSNIQILIKTGTKEIKMLLFGIKKDREFTENMNKENGRLIGFNELDKKIQIEMSNHC